MGIAIIFIGLGALCLFLIVQRMTFETRVLKALSVFYEKREVDLSDIANMRLYFLHNPSFREKVEKFENNKANRTLVNEILKLRKKKEKYLRKGDSEKYSDFRNKEAEKLEELAVKFRLFWKKSFKYGVYPMFW